MARWPTVRGIGLLLLAWAFLPGIVRAQTPSPMQEWQYSSGIILERLFEPNLPDWRVVAGLGAEFKPLYDGAKDYRTQGGPVLNVRYKDIAFASVGEGFGYNFIRGDNYRAGIALSYDLGRRVSDDYTHLHGLPDIGRAPVVKMFGSYVISKDFPMIFRWDVRQLIINDDGLVGDVGVYMPLPGSSRTLIMFAGPSMTFANHRYLQKNFGITPGESLTSGYSEYNAHAGLSQGGIGFSATYFLTHHWLVNADLAENWLLGSESDSPITQRRSQHVLALSVAYNW